MTKTIKHILLLLLLLWLMFTLGCSEGTIFDAAEEGDIERVTAYLDSHPDAARATDKYGISLVHRAARGGRTRLVEILLSRGAEVDNNSRKNKSGFTPLMTAAYRGHLETVRLLVEKGADVNKLTQGKKYRTNAVNVAANGGHIEIVNYLLQKGARLNVADKRVRGPLISAVFWGRTDLVRVLVTHGANVNCTFVNDNTVLHYAVMEGNREIIEMLLDNGAAINHKNSYGRTPLHYILYWRRDMPELTRLLLERGAEVNVIDKSKSTPLHHAAWKRFARSAELLLEKGARVDYLDDLGRTALAVANDRGGKSVARLLLCMHRAAAKSDTPTLSALMKRFPQLLNSRDEDGKTPLHHAAENNRLKNAKLLMDAGADVNVTSRFKRIRLLHSVIAKLLVPEIGRIKRNHDRKTPLAMAVRLGYLQMARLLRDRGANE